MASPKIEVVLKTCCNTTGEGPHWDVPSQSLWFVDLIAGDIHRWNSETNTDSKIHLDGTVSFVVPRDKGGLVIGHNKDISVVDFDTKAVTRLADVESGTNNRFNDGKCDTSGRLWAGTMGAMLSNDPPTFERQKGALYSMSTTDHSVTKHQGDIDISNGLAWSLDNKTMYYIDSIPRKVFSYDYDINVGSMANEKVVCDFEKEGIAGLPDGMCIDCDGKLWVACYAGSQVVRIDPQTGKCLQSVKFETTDITSVCFGGKNLDELYVTCNAHHNTQPLAGSIFRVTNLGVKGMAPTNFKG